MKVCHFTSAHPSTDIRIFHKECVSLATGGFEVFLVAANSENTHQNGVHLISTNSKKRGRLGRMIFTAREVYLKAKSINADVYHFHDPELLRFAKRLKKAGKLVIYDAHEDLPRQIMAKLWIPLFLRQLVSMIAEKFEDRIVRNMNYVVTATPHIRSRFIQINPNTVDVCNYSILSEFDYHSDWQNKNYEICYVGGISEARGIDQLMESLKSIAEIRLNLAGNFSSLHLRTQITGLKEWERVNYLGFVGRDELREVFKTSKIGVVTLLPTPNHLQSLPIKMFEYMSAGIPVIASNFPLWKIIIEENECGICVDPTDPHDIQRGIRFLLDNPNRAMEMGRNGKKMVLEKYNWQVESQKLLGVYNQLMTLTASNDAYEK